MSVGDTVRDFRCSSAMRSMLLRFSSRTGFVRMLLGRRHLVNSESEKRVVDALIGTSGKVLLLIW